MHIRPTLIINKAKVERNISRMAKKSGQSGTVFRPHFKTHQSAEVGALFRKRGVGRITVSSVSMARYFASHGWNDITIAFPVNLREANEISELAGQIRLNVLVDSKYAAEKLAKLLRNETGVFIEIDNGYHRSGLLPEETGVMDKITDILTRSGKLHFKGFLTHAGNTYHAKSREGILTILHDTATEMNRLKERYKDRFPDLIVSYGDTPSCSIAGYLGAFDEIRPGNFVYNDLMQYQLGACTLDDIAVAVACPVVAVYPQRNKLILYGGAVHLSKEYITDDKGRKIFGYIALLTKDGWSAAIAGAYVSSVSQEHGIVTMSSAELTQFKPGDVLAVLPIHSCLTANLLQRNTEFL